MTRKGQFNPIRRISLAISKAEGWFPGSLSQRNHNPGNLKDTKTGQLRVFPDDAAGWAALDRQVWLIVSGNSSIYKPYWTIRQIAVVYTGGDNADAWARIVSNELNRTPESRLPGVRV